MIRYRIRLLAGIAMLWVFPIAAACGDGPDTVPTNSTRAAGDGALEAVITSSDLAVGPQRFAFVLLQDDTPVSEEAISVRFFKIKDEKNPQLVGEGAIPFSPLGIPGLTTSGSELTGVYYANVTFDEAGKWGAGFTVGAKSDPAKEVRVAFDVKPKTATVAVGGKAIAVENPTLKTAPLKQIDTSSEPDEPFHQLSIAQALANDKPTVIAFATPAFCETRTCGPTMQIVNAAYNKFGDRVNWVHVEPYKLDASGRIVVSNGVRVNSDAGNAWSLPTEPWVFVIDKDGTVVGRFDGPLTLEEMDTYLADLARLP